MSCQSCGDIRAARFRVERWDTDSGAPLQTELCAECSKDYRRGGFWLVLATQPDAPQAVAVEIRTARA